ncbi:MAG TPA: DUF488 family protein [Propionibacterium sp.]|nr:DUF488 family protein [Propionibacterium sp.]
MKKAIVVTKCIVPRCLWSVVATHETILVPHSLRRDAVGAAAVRVARPVDVAPSTELRQWYGHDPARFDEFVARYCAELDASGAARALADDLAGEPVVPLLVGARDVENSQGLVLLERLRRQR